jgi:hypothetical protein
VTAHFRGAAVLAAVRADLLARGMASASAVVVGGCSAGGLAVFLHCDEWQRAMAAALASALAAAEPLAPELAASQAAAKAGPGRGPAAHRVCARRPLPRQWRPQQWRRPSQEAARRQ